MPKMLPTIWSISVIVAARRSMVAALPRDCALASWAVLLARPPAAEISSMAARSPSMTDVAVVTFPSSRRPAPSSSASRRARPAAR